MQKVIRVLAIVSAALVLLSLLLLLVTVPFQKLLADILFDCPEKVADVLPLFPWPAVLTTLLRLLLIVLLVIGCCNQKSGVWMEILVFAGLVLVLPVIHTAMNAAYNTLMINMHQVEYATANSIVNRIINYCLSPGGLGTALAYFVCGMSVVFKLTQKSREENMA